MKHPLKHDLRKNNTYCDIQTVRHLISQYIHKNMTNISEHQKNTKQQFHAMAM